MSTILGEGSRNTVTGQPSEGEKSSSTPIEGTEGGEWGKTESCTGKSGGQGRQVVYTLPISGPGVKNRGGTVPVAGWDPGTMEGMVGCWPCLPQDCLPGLEKQHLFAPGI